MSLATDFLDKSTTVRTAKLLTAKTVVHSANVLSPVAAGWLAKRLFSLPRRFRRPLREFPLIRSGIQTPLPTRHGVLAGWRWGDGPTILMVHGWEGRGAQLGAMVEPLVRAGFQVLLYDNPGHGDSPGLFGSALHFADAIEDIAKQFELYGVVAHSMGTLATSLAIRRGVKVQRLTYLAPTAAPDRGVEMMQELLELPVEVVDEMKRQMLSEQPMSWDDLAAGALPKERDAALLIIADTDDDEVPLSLAHDLHRNWPDSALTVTSGHGHRRMLWQPELVEAVADHMTETTAEERRRVWPWKVFLQGEVGALAFWRT